MGCSASAPTPTSASTTPKYIPDQFKTLNEVQAELRKNGLEQCNLIIGIDCTKSNTWQGEKTFGGKCLHDVSTPQTPYERVLRCIGTTLAQFDDDKQIPLYGFGDDVTHDNAVFNFRGVGLCNGFDEALYLYRQVIPRIRLSGPTNFAPVINEAIRIVQNEGGFHILLIIADGAVDEKKETIDAIIRASNYALAIIIIGVGDGPWDLMEKFDDDVGSRKFDNLQFVNSTAIFMNPRLECPEANFAMQALMEVPAQFKYLKGKGMIKEMKRRPVSPPVQIQNVISNTGNPSAPPPY